MVTRSKILFAISTDKQKVTNWSLHQATCTKMECKIQWAEFREEIITIPDRFLLGLKKSEIMTRGSYELRAKFVVSLMD